MFRNREEAPVIEVRRTPIERLSTSHRVGENLWVKRDDLTNSLYGGNKVRKLDVLLSDARRRDARRIVTMGAAGSHHVLATSLFAQRMGIPVVGVLAPQLRSAHSIEMLRATFASGAELHAASSPSATLRVLASVVRRGDVVIPLGGSTPASLRGYVDAMREVRSQIASGEAPCPTDVVVATGSGGTAAGIALGLVEAGIDARVHAVIVANPPSGPALGVRALIASAGVRRARAALARVVFDDRWLGAGYGVPTASGLDATDEAATNGLAVDPTYTAKSLAAAMASSRAGRVVLWVHTLSAAPMAPLLADAPEEDELPPALRALLF
jgi:D-cysteine desulfhydrase